MNGGESVSSWRVLRSMMLEGEKSSKSNSKRCSFGDKCGMEWRDRVRFFRVQRAIARVLDRRRWWHGLDV